MTQMVQDLFRAERHNDMNKPSILTHSLTSDIPYDPEEQEAVDTFWANATAHTGLAALKAKRGRPKKHPSQRKEQISLRIDADVLAWYRALGTGWQTQMNKVLKAHHQASL